MDVLTDVLQTVRVKTACYGRLEAGAPWGLRVPGGEDAKFHVVLEGNCWLDVEGTPSVALSAGDLVALPHGHEHVLSDASGAQLTPLDSVVSCGNNGSRSNDAGTRRIGGSGAQTILVSGRISFEDRRNNPLLAVLPPVIPLLGEAGRSVPWLESTLQFIACEASSGRPGAQTVISRLADILFIQIVRGHLAQLNEANNVPGWLGALSEPQIGAALSLVHQRPEQSWTVASLAQRVGMSRSAFASRFTRLVGEPPLHYVTRWRMQKAAGLLREGRATLAEIAEQVGYESETAFSKAFKRAVGSSPGAYRRTARSVSTAPSAAA